MFLCVYIYVCVCVCVYFNTFILYNGLPWWLNSEEPTAKQGMRVQSLGQEDLLEKEMATHPSILPWEIPWTEEPGGLQPMGSQKVEHGLVPNEPTAVFLPGESQGREAWWAAIYGVAQSQTRLKRHSSSA